MRNAGEEEQAAATYLLLANAHRLLMDFEPALEAAQKVVAIGQKLRDRRIEANGLRALTSVYSFMGKYEETSRISRSVQEIYQEIGDLQGEAAALNGLGIASIRHRDPGGDRALLHQLAGDLRGDR